MGDTVKCHCGKCGAKYRLPIEFQGRTARCKKCGESFKVPQEKNLEDTVLDWLTEPAADEVEEPVEQPKVISMSSAPKAEGDQKNRGIIRHKDAPSAH